MTGLPFGCACGQIRGTLHAAKGRQLQCHCDDCRRAIIYLGQPDPGPAGVRYLQTTPNNISLDAGADALKAMIWKNPRLMRWYAPCCGAAMFNTLDNPKWAFASLLVDRLDNPAALPAVKTHAFIPKKGGKRGHTQIASFALGFIRRTVGARLSGTWRDTPFFDENAKPRAAVQTLTPQDRATAKL